MRKILQVALREYVETVKTKTFIIGLLMVPVIIGGIILFAGRFASGQGGPRPPMRVPVDGPVRCGMAPDPGGL